jgi:hypothetical protein
MSKLASTDTVRRQRTAWPKLPIVVREITVVAYKNKQYSIRSLKNEDEDDVFGTATGYGLEVRGLNPSFTKIEPIPVAERSKSRACC